MKVDFIQWIKSKLNSIEDHATPADWKAMEEMIRAEPALAAKPWYNSGWGIGGVISIVTIIAISVFYSSQFSSSFQGEENAEKIAAEVKEIQEVKKMESEISIDVNASLNTSNSHSVQPTSSEVSDHIIEDSRGNVALVKHPVQEANPIHVEELRSIEVRTSKLVSAEPIPTQLNRAVLSKENTDSGERPRTSSENSQAQALPVSNTEWKEELTTDPTQEETPEMAPPKIILSSVSHLEQSGSTLAVVSENAAPTKSEILLNEDDYFQRQWSTSVYLTYGIPQNSIPKSESVQNAPSSNKMGFGLEVNYQRKRWMLSTGFNTLFENREIESITEHVQVLHGVVNWFEWDTTSSVQIDSNWVSSGGGYWSYDTTFVMNVDSVLIETRDTLSRTTRTIENRELKNARWSIPFMVGTQIRRGKWKSIAQIGPVFTLSSTNWYRAGEFIHRNYSYGVDAMVRIELHYAILPKWSVFTRVACRTNLTANNDFRLGPFERWNMPVSVGLNYSF